MLVQRASLQKLIQLDAGLEFHEKFLFDEIFRNQMILLLLKGIKILQKYNYISIQDYDIDEMIELLEKDPENES